MRDRAAGDQLLAGAAGERELRIGGHPIWQRQRLRVERLRVERFGAVAAGGDGDPVAGAQAVRGGGGPAVEQEPAGERAGAEGHSVDVEQVAGVRAERQRRAGGQRHAAAVDEDRQLPRASAVEQQTCGQRGQCPGEREGEHDSRRPLQHRLTLPLRLAGVPTACARRRAASR